MKAKTDISFVRNSYRSEHQGKEQLPNGALSKLSPEKQLLAMSLFPQVVEQFKKGIGDTLSNGNSIDPIESYASFIGLSRLVIDTVNAGETEPITVITANEEIPNLHVVLKNAVTHPDSFSQLKSYENQRMLLAHALGSMGILDGAAEGIVVTMTSPFPDGHKNESGQLQTMAETFSLNQKQ